MKKFIPAIGVLYLLPLVTLAQEFGEVSDFIGNIIGFINSTLVPLVFAIAFLIFLWGVFKYFILGGADEGKREEGRQLMLYAIIGFVLMVSIWGIVNLLAGGLGLREDTLEGIPNAPTTNSN